MVEYRVKAGETLHQIARRHEVSVEDLRRANGRTAKDDARLGVGERLSIPGDRLEPTTRGMGRARVNTNVVAPSPPKQSRTGMPMSGTTTASWYGPGFIGKKTASGKKYTGQEFTAANRYLPFGTKVRLTSIDRFDELGRPLSVVVTIDDDGPHKSDTNGKRGRKDRLFDLSPRARAALGGGSVSYVRWEVESIPEGKPFRRTREAPTYLASTPPPGTKSR